MEGRSRKSRRGVAIRARAVLLLIVWALGACAGPVEPRWAAPTPSGSVELFESPRQTLLFDSSPDIGELRLDGVVRAAEVTEVQATDDGRVVDVFLEAGDRVVSGDQVLAFQPGESRGVELEREILMLRRELADEQGDGETLADVDLALAALEQSVLDSAVIVEAPVSGILLNVSAGLIRPVNADSGLFEIATADDVVVTVDAALEQVDGIAVGDAVTARASSVGARARTAVVTAIDEELEADRVMLTIEPDEPFTVDDLGQAIEIDVDLGNANEAVWVDRRLVHRQDGESFLLAEDGEGQLERLDVGFGRRTETHVEVQEVASSPSALTQGRVLVLP